MKMRFNGVILIIPIIEVCSVSRIFAPNHDDPLTVAAVCIQVYLLGKSVANPRSLIWSQLANTMQLVFVVSFLACIIISHLLALYFLGYTVLVRYVSIYWIQVNIADKCFGYSERWSELLIVPNHDFHGILGRIHRELKTSSLIASPGEEKKDKLICSGKCNDHSNIGVAWQKTKTTAVLITTYSLQHLESVLGYLKHEAGRIWRPRSYFIIVLETECELATCNNMFKVVWKYWILNAVVVCSSNNPPDQNKSGIRLYTFNPYSADHSPHWKSVIHELVEVSVHPRNFNHSWYIFEQRYAEIISSEDCGDLFFDKTSNLDGYVVPISLFYPDLVLNTTISALMKPYVADARMLFTLARTLRFNFAQVPNRGAADYGRRFENGCYAGILEDIYTERSHLAPTHRGVGIFPGIGMTYPHSTSGACFATRIVGNRPQWKNLADAKHIWITLGLGLLFSTAVLYLQNRSSSIMSAFLDAERLITGNSIIRTSAFFKHRIILGSIFLVVLVIDGTIRGRFVSILTVARPYSNLDTIEELREQKVDVYGHINFKSLITDAHVKARLNVSMEIPECVKSLERDDQQRACFADCRSLRYMTLNSSYLHVSLPIMTTHVTFFTSMHWPMKTRYSLEVQKLVESGIFERWYLETYREFQVDSWKLKRAEEPPYVRSTRLNDLLPAFVLLFVGLSVALIAFAWEMIAGTKKLHFNKNN